MAFPTFTPPRLPSPGTSLKKKPKLNKAEFGDGYTQVSRAGLNHLRREIQLSWEKLTPSEANTIENFLTLRGGDQPFYYTPSNEATPVKWTCEDWSTKVEKTGFHMVSATFVQSFQHDG
jgi:phage-related protein